MQDEDYQRRVGTLVRDNWTLVRLLGVGGMAAVYVGVHRIGRRDALKILHTEAAKSKDAGKVMAQMKATPTDDPLFGKGEVRKDGRVTHDMYLFQVKKPDESKGPWDYYKLLATIPAAEAFQPMAEAGCPLAK